MSRAGGRGRDASATRASLQRFALLSVGTLALLTVALVLSARSTAHDLAVDEGRQRAQRIAQQLAAPLVDHRTRQGESEAVARLATAMDLRMRDGSVAHVKVWDRGGRVIWSDEEALVGRRFELPPAVADLFGTTGDVAEISDLEAAENAEETESELLEIYVGAFDADRRPIVFETYLPPDRIQQDEKAFFIAFLPVALALLVAFQLVVLPLGVVLARRVDRAHRQRSAILDRSLEAWHKERRQLAQDLHDGVVQKLSVASYMVPNIVDDLPPEPATDRARRDGGELQRLIHAALRDLRKVVSDQFPGDLRTTDLTEALTGLTRPAAESGLGVRVQVDPTLALPAQVNGLVYRVVREGLRNVTKHARADTVTVSVTRQGEEVVVRVVDDGEGVTRPVRREGHLGLHLLSSVLLDVGGTLTLRGADPRGSVLEGRIPVG